MGWRKQINRTITILLSISVSQAFATEVVNYYVIANQAQPFQIEENGENHSGIVSDIVEEIFSGSDYSLAYHTYPFNRMISVLEAGGEENWVTYGSPNWGKAQSEHLSDLPIYQVKHSVVTSAKKTFIYEDLSSIKDKGIVLLLGFDYAELNPYIEKGELSEIRVKNYEAAFRVIQRLPDDTAFVEMESRVKYHLNRLGLNQEDYRVDNFSEVIANYPIHLAFSGEMKPEIKAFINQRLAEMKENGSLEEIISRYI
ncbi:substrate-binding periplasmic protein [Vibrio sp. TBV020]|uniref:substrate-binding periplasmic protein n=1 Tax=Vibrio sp. TBV020 TaxID=3137398 RepID=UPI0038CDABD6